MDLQSAILFLVAVIAAVLVAQTILLLILVIAFRKWFSRTGVVLDQVSRTAEDISRTSQPVLQSARELLTESREKISGITSNLNEMSLTAKNQVARIDDFLKDATARAQLQVLRMDELLSDLIIRVDQTADAVQNGVLKPVREVAAVVSGVKASLNFLLSRNRKTVERATQDEELFI